MTYYNEHDPKAAAWLQELESWGYISEGTVDPRDVQNLSPLDVTDERCHFFAGIGGWDLACQLSGWSGPIWTASLPCQPFSQAGKQRGASDHRHLWPVFYDLVAECLPPVIVGEQVASKAGRAWLAAVRADLEALGYAVGAADLCAAGVGAPHIRQRLYWCAIWVGHSELHGSPTDSRELGRTSQERGTQQPKGPGGGLADPVPTGRSEGGTESGQRPSPWSSVVYLPCADGKARPIKPGIEPLVDGLPGRVGLLRGYGNAIVPQVAAVFLQSVMDLLP